MLSTVNKSAYDSYPESFWRGIAYDKVSSGKFTNRSGEYRYNTNQRIGFSENRLLFLEIGTRRNMDTGEKSPIQGKLLLFKGDFRIVDGVFTGGTFDEVVEVTTPQTYTFTLSDANYRLIRFNEGIDFGQWIVDPDLREIQPLKSEFFLSTSVNRTNVGGGYDPILQRFTPNRSGSFTGYTYVETPEWNSFSDQAVQAGFPSEVLSINFPLEAEIADRTSTDLDETFLTSLGFQDTSEVQYPLEPRFYIHPELPSMGFQVLPGRQVVREGESLGIEIAFEPIPLMATTKQLWWRIDEAFNGTEVRNDFRDFFSSYYGSLRTSTSGSFTVFVNPREDRLPEDDEIYTVSVYDSPQFQNQLASASFVVRDANSEVERTLFDTKSSSLESYVQQYLPGKPSASQFLDINLNTYMQIVASTWKEDIRINKVVRGGAAGGERLLAKQVDGNSDPRVGSVISGSDSDDIIGGLKGWDILDGRGGNDFIRGGNGRDIITGGLGNDELHGDFGWNTYTSEKDGSADLIVIKSDQFLLNPLLGKAGNNSDGAKCDIIEGLDSIDRIRILGVRSSDISIQDNVTAKGVTGIGIFGGGYLEALYIGGDLTVSQITAMTSGDASPAAMANQISSYGWIDAPGTLIDEFTSENPASAIVPDYITGESVSSSVDPDDVSILAKASTWSGSIRINRIAQAAANGGEINAVQTYDGGVGSVLLGSNRNDVLRGRAGWDLFDGRGGNDFIRGGNGRDIITGGLDSDELWGDLGWNTYTSEKDGSADLIVIKSDQFLLNPLLGKAGNNSDGAKCDIIEGLDTIDRIRILGVSTQDLTFRNDVTAKGVTGIGIYGGGYLEALYIGGDLSLSQITAMTSGDASPAAMANQISSYGWTQNPGLFIS